MHSFTISFQQARSGGPFMQIPLRIRPRRRDLATVPGLADRLEAPGHDATLVIDAVYEHHQCRQAMLSALALLRGDDASERLW